MTPRPDPANAADPPRTPDPITPGGGSPPQGRFLPEELHGLLALLCDQGLDAEGWRRLDVLLTDHPAARSYYLKLMAMHSALTAVAGSPAACSPFEAQLAVERAAIERFSARPLSLRERVLGTDGLSVAPPRTRGGWSRGSLRGWSMLAAGLLIAAIAGWWGMNGADPSDQATVAETSPPPGAPLAQIHNEADPGALAAEVTFVSDRAAWSNPNASFALASRVRAGEVLSLDRGLVELTYASGARLMLTGPTELRVLPEGAKLHRGELVAHVPQAGHGFIVETPTGKVIDLGTEFGVVVDDFGVSQVSVFEGKVEALPDPVAGLTPSKIQLTSGRAVQWAEGQVIPIEFRGYGYPRTNQASLDPIDSAATKKVLDLDLLATQNDHGPVGGEGTGEFPPSLQPLGALTRIRGGIRLGPVEGADPLPYLLTRSQVDPSVGPVTVSCDVRFVDDLEWSETSFAIFTRCSNRRSKPTAPWRDMLAQGVRCRFAADSSSGEGLLDSGTKYEADRELCNISWGGFTSPRKGDRYRFEMRDDGLNVAFTVSLVENPSVRKTITCRSLFRGEQNFVGLEGSTSSGAVVERLSITQQLIPQQPQREGSTAQLADPSVGEVVDRLLAEWAPPGASLLVADDFDGKEIDPAKWTTLGETTLEDGAVRLGAPNARQHIDTWKARPYLLTQEPLDPENGALTILGLATFSENFLHGYGGSFAVMTRAEGEHGGGPAWENSILSRGIRANFWPSAVGFDHSLEIHEKPSKNTISLLAARGFVISPNSRAYCFKVVDDGRSARLTFADAADPRLQQSIEARTPTQMTSTGHVGFESCWGSPVLLDNVRIYQAKPSVEASAAPE